MVMLSGELSGDGRDVSIAAPRETEDSFGRLVRSMDKRLLQAPVRAVSALCDGACRVLDGARGRLGPLGGPVRAVGTRLADVARTVGETATGLLRDVCLTALDVPRLFLRHVARAIRLLRQGRGRGALGALGRAVSEVGLRVAGFAMDAVSRAAQGVVNGALTLAFAEAPSRALLPEEVQQLRQVYGESIDYAVVRIKRGGSTEWVGMAPHVVGNIVYMTNHWGGHAAFHPDGSLTTEGLETLIHEVGHVWQHQNGGGAYIHRALLAQLRAFLQGGARHGAYLWRRGYATCQRFEELNPEQQASLLEEVGLALRHHGQVVSTAWRPPLSPPELNYVMDAWARARRGEGCGV